MIGAIFRLLFLLQIPVSVPPVSPPDTVSDASAKITVCYFKDGDNWTPMQPASAGGANTRGFDMFIYTGGYTDLGMDVTFAAPKAPLRILSKTPVFMISTTHDSTSEPVLVRLQKKKDRRVCRAKLSATAVDNRYGFRKSDIVRTIVTVNPDNSVLVRPEQRLKAGEYLLVSDAPASGCDFGID